MYVENKWNFPQQVDAGQEKVGYEFCEAIKKGVGMAEKMWYNKKGQAVCHREDIFFRHRKEGEHYDLLYGRCSRQL